MKKIDYFRLSLCYNIISEYDIIRQALFCLTDNNMEHYWSKYKSSSFWDDCRFKNYLFSEYTKIKNEIDEKKKE